MGVISARRAASEKAKLDHVRDPEVIARQAALKVSNDHAAATNRAIQKHENSKTNDGNVGKRNFAAPVLPPPLEEAQAPEEKPKPKEKETVLSKVKKTLTGRGRHPADGKK